MLVVVIRAPVKEPEKRAFCSLTPAAGCYSRASLLPPNRMPRLPQGILVVVNSNASFTNEQLQSMLQGQFGQIRSVENSAANKDHKLVEFYDGRFRLANMGK